MAVIERHVFAHDGLAFHYRAAGEGPPLVMLHGGGSRAGNFDAIIPRLAASFRVYAYDQRGFGDTGAEPGRDIDHQLWSDDLQAFLDHLYLDRSAVCGWSLGSTIALNAASQQPDRISALVLLGAAHPDRPIDRAYFLRRLAMVEAGASAAQVVADTFDMVSGMFSPWTLAHRPEALEQVRQEQLGNRVDLVAPLVAAYESRPDVGAILRAIVCPVAVLAGDADQGGLLGAEALSERLPLCRVERIPNCGHYYAVEQPEAVAEAMVRGLRWATALGL
jgi:pimeloyl-ACP methyl ester carboxylesterase